MLIVIDILDRKELKFRVSLTFVTLKNVPLPKFFKLCNCYTLYGTGIVPWMLIISRKVPSLNMNLSGLGTKPVNIHGWGHTIFIIDILLIVTSVVKQSGHHVSLDQVMIPVLHFGKS